MEKINTRNSSGVKDSTNVYRTLKGANYKHWTSGATLEECRKENPEMTFIKRGDNILYLVI